MFSPFHRYEKVLQFHRFWSVDDSQVMLGAWLEILIIGGAGFSLGASCHVP